MHRACRYGHSGVWGWPMVGAQHLMVEEMLLLAAVSSLPSAAPGLLSTKEAAAGAWPAVVCQGAELQAGLVPPLRAAV